MRLLMVSDFLYTKKKIVFFFCFCRKNHYNLLISINSHHRCLNLLYKINKILHAVDIRKKDTYKFRDIFFLLQDVHTIVGMAAVANM